MLAQQRKSCQEANGRCIHLINYSARMVNDRQRWQIGQLGADLRSVAIPSGLPTPFADGIARLVDQVGYRCEEWQQFSILILPPDDSFIAIGLIAEIHRRMRLFPNEIVPLYGMKVSHTSERGSAPRVDSYPAPC